MVSSSVPTAEAVSPPEKREPEKCDSEKEKIESVECKSIRDSDLPSSHEAEAGRSSSTGYAIVTRKELWSYYRVYRLVKDL
jgi:hypothetical protein